MRDDGVRLPTDPSQLSRNEGPGSQKIPCSEDFGKILTKDLRAPHWEGRSRNVN